MKKKWTNNLGFKILSVAIAFLLWVVIINIEDPTISRTFRVQVDIQNDDIVASGGKVYKITEGEYVEVTVKGNKSFVDSLTDADITATADFRYLSNYGSVPITAKCRKYTTTKYSVELGSVDHVLVELEDLMKNRFIVRFNVVGEPPSGYYIDTNLITSNPTKVTVTGGESVIKSIGSIEVNIDATGQTSDFTEKLVPRVYDNSGNLIESDNVTCSVSEVTVNVTVLETKRIPVNVEVVGEPRQGFTVEPAIYDPAEITIAGTRETLKKISSVDLTMPIHDKDKSVKKVVDLLDGYLPEGIYVVGDKSSINIEVPIEQLESKELTFDTSDIAVKLPTGISNYNFENANQQFKVRVFAVAGEIHDITVEALKPTIDLTDKSLGIYDTRIAFNDTYVVEPVSDINVRVELSNPDEQGPPSTTPRPPMDTPRPSVTEVVTATPAPTVTLAPTKKPESEPTATQKETASPTETPRLSDENDE